MNWDYLAGFVDGEGSITISRSSNSITESERYQVRLSIGNTNKEVLENIREFLYQEGLSVISLPRSRNDPRVLAKPCWTLRITGKRLEKVLPNLVERLIIKRKQAELAISFLPLIKERGQYHDDWSRLTMAVMSDKMSYLNRQ